MIVTSFYLATPDKAGGRVGDLEHGRVIAQIQDLAQVHAASVVHHRAPEDAARHKACGVQLRGRVETIAIKHDGSELHDGQRAVPKHRIQVF